MDTNSSERDNQDWNGLCAKTKVVMQYLNQYFMNQKKKREQEVVSWMPLVEGRSKKRNAMLFYEILVFLGLFEHFRTVRGPLEQISKHMDQNR
ncbi:uncharacterized protein [Euphorbia lathyris]|uniref:uncharacterized protein isoform X2 n=1 Tax=Euphorbia lathyris TaxID=212925 RepID=UPI00331393DB